MSMHAPCLSEALARSYSDPHSSSSSFISIPKRSLPSRRKGRHHLTARSMISSLFLLLLALPIASAIFDPGQSDEGDVSPIASVVPERPTLSSSGGSSISLIAPKGHPISLHPGCKRTTDLFDNVCHNPWSPFSTSNRKSHSAGHSELVICPVGDVNENGERERVFAITGTITLPESTAAELEAASPSAVSTLGDKEADWPKPGDEGFWRQRDGELEWVPTEVRALLESVPIEGDVTPAITTKTEVAREESIKPSEVAHVEEYHAWSESVGGEESKTWLSFEKWREHHLAAEKEQEKQRIAAGKKQKHDKAKEKKNAQGQAGNATEKVSEVHSNISIDDVNTTRIGGVQNNTNLQTSSDPLPEKPSGNHLTASDEKAEGKPQRDPSQEAAAEEPGEPAVIKADTSQDTSTIPAIADASSLLGTLKHRWNFASFDCAAVVHRANPSAKFTSAILSEKKDRYMLSPCPQGNNDPQFVVVELCDEISVDTIVLANYEFFSRMFKRFRVRVARNLNGGEADWYDIGTFRARNIRGLQVFNTIPPKADSRFFRYVRIDFLEHYGSEFYCPVSLLRVYGLTQMDDYIREEEEMRRQREAELTLADSESIEEDDEEEKIEEVQEKEVSLDPTPTSTATETATHQTANSDQTEVKAQSITSDSAPTSIESATRASITPVHSYEQPIQSSEAPSDTSTSSSSTVTYSDTPVATASVNATQGNMSKTVNATTEAILQGAEGALSKPVIDLGEVYANKTITKVSGQDNQTVNASVSVATVSREESAIDNITAVPAHGITNNSSTEPSSAVLNNASTVSISSAVDVKDRVSNATSTPPPAAQPVSSSEASKPAMTGQQQQNTGGSESIYRTITKRLNMLEMNATLSLQYMEHSRQQLGEVFSRMERNQRDKIAEMLKELNASNWRQIESLKRRQQVDLQQAIFEFDKHRQQTDAERRQLLAQVHILSNEVILEKRFGIAQLVLLLGLFVFMGLTRGSKATPLINQGIAHISNQSSQVAQREPLQSSPGRSRASTRVQSNANSQIRVLPSPSPSGMRQLHPYRPFLTPRLDRHNRGLERAVPIRGHSNSKAFSTRGPKSAGLLTLSPVPMRRKKTASISSTLSQRHDSDSAGSSLQDHGNSSVLDIPVSRPVIMLDTNIMPEEEAELETPNQNFASQVRSSKFKREDTPTNLSEARQFEAIPPSLAPSTSGLSLSESYGSDWGTERSDDEQESHTSIEPLNNELMLNGIAPPNSSSTVSTPVLLPLRSPVDQIVESDAEEDSPKWNSVKSRRSVKRPNSSGSTNNTNGWHSHFTNGHSRGHTPPNHLISTPTRRSFSPFHKNAEIEIN